MSQASDFICSVREQKPKNIEAAMILADGAVSHRVPNGDDVEFIFSDGSAACVYVLQAGHLFSVLCLPRVRNV